MKTSKMTNRLMMGSLILAAGIVASCGNTGVGANSITMNTTCDTLDVKITAGTDSITAGTVMGRIVVIATKPAIQRTKFGNDTILDNTTEVVNIPASGLPLYIDVTNPELGFSPDPIIQAFTIGPVGGVQETMPTTFFTDSEGRADLEIQMAQTWIPSVKYTAKGSITIGVRQGEALDECAYTFTAQ